MNSYLKNLIKLFRKRFLTINKDYDAILHRLIHLTLIDEINVLTYLFFEKYETKFSVSLLIKCKEFNTILYEQKNIDKYEFNKKSFNRICCREILKSLKLIDKLKFSSYFGFFDVNNFDDLLEDEKKFICEFVKNGNCKLSSDFCCVCYSLTQNKLDCCNQLICLRCYCKIKNCPLCRERFPNQLTNIFDTMLIGDRIENLTIQLQNTYSDIQNLI
jgi:hypothetical protein